jgi:hypothetical protein
MNGHGRKSQKIGGADSGHPYIYQTCPSGLRTHPDGQRRTTRTECPCSGSAGREEWWRPVIQTRAARPKNRPAQLSEAWHR